MRQVLGAGRNKALSDGQWANLKIAEPDAAAVILQEEVGFDLVAEAVDVLEFALGDGGFHCRAAAFVAQDFNVIEPVFDVIAFDQDD